MEIFIEKTLENSVKETWVAKNLKNLYEYIIEKEGSTISEKIFILRFGKKNCKLCGKNTKFLSYERGYRKYCSKKCSNSDPLICEIKEESYRKTCQERWGVNNASKSDIIKDKIKNSKKNLDYEEIYEKFKSTNIIKWGVENPSNLDYIKEKRKMTTIKNWGVENPFQSEIIKDKIKKTNINNIGVDSPLKSEEIKEKIRITNLEKWGVDNFTKSKVYKEIMFDKYRSKEIKTNLNTDEKYHSYLGLGVHRLWCDGGENHIYDTNSHLYHSRKNLYKKQCTICFPVDSQSSFKEKELLYFIKSIYQGEIIECYKDGLEIDIYIPELKLGFEFNGIYWHSELFKGKSYHLDKTNHFNQMGIRIIHIWEDDWDMRREILKSQIKNWLSLTDNKIWARKCEIREIYSIDEYRSFLNKNHIQGYTSASIKIGLYYENELVSLMTFDHFEGRKKMKSSEWNLSRFCNKINVNVIGGASRLLSYFVNKFKPKRIISFSDNSWSKGELYNKLGFSLVSVSRPNYSYIIDKKRSNKQKWKKSNLVKMGFDVNLSESKIMEDNFGAYKIFDCGQSKFEINYYI